MLKLKNKLWAQLVDNIYQNVRSQEKLHKEGYANVLA